MMHNLSLLAWSLLLLAAADASTHHAVVRRCPSEPSAVTRWQVTYFPPDPYQDITDEDRRHLAPSPKSWTLARDQIHKGLLWFQRLQRHDGKGFRGGVCQLTYNINHRFCWKLDFPYDTHCRLTLARSMTVYHKHKKLPASGVSTWWYRSRQDMEYRSVDIRLTFDDPANPIAPVIAQEMAEERELRRFFKRLMGTEMRGWIYEGPLPEPEDPSCCTTCCTTCCAIM